MSATPEIRRTLANAGVDVDEGFVTFELDEADAAWPMLAPRLTEWRAVDMPRTSFTKKEYAAAEWLEMCPTWHHGYPQPNEGDFGYLSVTYAGAPGCSACGAGARQVAPFRMKKEPRWGKKSILQLNWVFDEFFVTPALYKDVFEPLGVEARPVLDSSGDHVLETVVQLSISEEVDVLSGSLPGATCSTCGRTKFAPVVRGYSPRPLHSTATPIVRTKEYFGSGHSAYQGILVSKDLFAELSQQKVKGVSFVPAR